MDSATGQMQGSKQVSLIGHPQLQGEQAVRCLRSSGPGQAGKYHFQLAARGQKFRELFICHSRLKARSRFSVHQPEEVIS
jgi:hypothetical protein